MSWLNALGDLRSKARIILRLNRLAQGHVGDARSVGDGVSELRFDTGPGYRVYFTRTGHMIVLLLCAGDKSTQSRDIARAKAIAQTVKGQGR